MAQRLDVWLVEHGGIASRSKAQAMIKNGNVMWNGKTADKPGQKVSEGDDIQITDRRLLRYVSRGGLKLEKAIESFQLDMKGVNVLDVGSSTGGFTDCALQHGAKKVIAVDVGTGVMDRELAARDGVELHEQTDIRNFPPEKIAEVDYVVCDVSFISVVSAIAPILSVPGHFALVLLIKPQFECGARTARRYKGVVRDSEIHEEVLGGVVEKLREYSFFLKDLTYSPICGGDGNIEYLAQFERGVADGYFPEKGKETIAEAFRELA